jgi:transcription termination factor Rho
LRAASRRRPTGYRRIGTARNIEGDASATIAGATLIDSGSRIAEGLFEGFKGSCVFDSEGIDWRTFRAVTV